MFEKLKQSLRDAMSRASSPAEGRAVLAMMREAVIEAKVGVSNLRTTVERTRTMLAAEQESLETVRRRGKLAAQINDTETVAVASRYEKKHAERVGVLERKLEAQQAELDLAERELDEMNRDLKQAALGTGFSPGVSPPEGAPPPSTEDTADELRRTVDRVAREAEAQRQLDELKRRMGR
jgi:hypothetical protein